MSRGPLTQLLVFWTWGGEVFRSLIWVLLTFIISVGIYLLLGGDLVQLTSSFVQRHVLQNVDVLPLTKNDAARLSSTPIEYWEMAPPPEFAEVAELYDRVSPPEGIVWDKVNQPFRLAMVELALQPSLDLGGGVSTTSSSAYVVFWPTGCRTTGCRHDLFIQTNDGPKLIAQLYVFKLKVTASYKNGLRILSDETGKYYWWNGQAYVVAT